MLHDGFKSKLIDVRRSIPANQKIGSGRSGAGCNRSLALL